jgi:aspartate aminotransferase-like enzyme
MVMELRESCEALKKIVFCDKGESFIISGAGTLAMEMALLNTAGPNDNILVLSQGYFGDRMGQICQAFGLSHDVIGCEWGKAVLPEQLAAQLSKKKYKVVVCTHVDTATGACSPVEEYARVMAETDALFIVDGVCATGGIPERMDAWGIDVVLTAAQKCLGTPPGLSVLVLSERAMEKRRSLASIPAFYSDLLRWLPIMHEPAKYFSTPCVNEIRAFYEGTRVIAEEGIEVRFRRHDHYARAMRAGLAAMGFGFFTDRRFLASTLSVVLYPGGVDDKMFRQTLTENGVVVAGGLASTLGKVFRMGHMGNLMEGQVVFALKAIEKTLRTLGYGFEAGSGAGAARAILGS